MKFPGSSDTTSTFGSDKSDKIEEGFNVKKKQSRGRTSAASKPGRRGRTTIRTNAMGEFAFAGHAVRRRSATNKRTNEAAFSLALDVLLIKRIRDLHSIFLGGDFSFTRQTIYLEISAVKGSIGWFSNVDEILEVSRIYNSWGTLIDVESVFGNSKLICYPRRKCFKLVLEASKESFDRVRFLETSRKIVGWRYKIK